MTISGACTYGGTKHFSERFAGIHAEGQFGLHQGLWLSSIGIGTYLGNWDDSTDRDYRQAVTRAVELGCNVIDTSVNYRFQRSERAIGQSLQHLTGEKGFDRGEIFLATKGGYLPFDGEPPANIRQYLDETFFGPGIIAPEELAGGGSHCLSPKYLDHQLELSRTNLGVDSVDLYYLHNPEQQLDDVPREDFIQRISRAFNWLEDCVDEGRVQFYGTATWNGFRSRSGDPGLLDLSVLVDLARAAGGVDHHFRFIQLPLNLAMPEAITLRNQEAGSKHIPVVEAALHLGITVVASASILQSRLAKGLPEPVVRGLKGLRTDAQRAIQFVRSTPGIAVALVGMSQERHVEENLEIARVPAASLEEFMALFSAAE